MPRVDETLIAPPSLYVEEERTKKSIVYFTIVGCRAWTWWRREDFAKKNKNVEDPRDGIILGG